MARKKNLRTEPIDEAYLQECFLCKKKFQFGHHVYDGKNIAAWGIIICNSCKSGNHDGIVIGHYPHLIKHLKDKGIEIELNAKGWLEIP